MLPLPANRRQPGPLLLLTVGTAGIVSADDDGTHRLTVAKARSYLAARAKHRMFAASNLADVVRVLGPHGMTVTVLGRAPIRIKLDDGPTIIGTGSLLDGDLETDWNALRRVDEWCWEHSVAFSSRGWTAEQLWRRTVPRRGWTFTNPLDRRGLAGGRKGILRPGVYTNCLYVDLAAAYPHAMGTTLYPLRLTHTRQTRLDCDGIALATVWVHPADAGDWPPLYESRAYGQVWRSGHHRGWYSLYDLRYAKEQGAKIDVEHVYRGADHVDLFGRWWALAQDLRTVGGRVGKAIANGLWGTLTFNRTVTRLRWQDHAWRPVSKRNPPTLGACHVGATITAQVRYRLNTELLPSAPIYIDTDGGIIRHGQPLPPGADDDPVPGGWSVRHIMKRVDIRGSQAYAFTAGDGRQKVVLAGVSKPTLADLGRRGGDPLDLYAHMARYGSLDRWRPTYVWDAEGTPVPLQPGWVQDELPAGWTVADPQTVGLQLPDPY